MTSLMASTMSGLIANCLAGLMAGQMASLKPALWPARRQALSWPYGRPDGKNRGRKKTPNFKHVNLFDCGMGLSYMAHVRTTALSKRMLPQYSHMLHHCRYVLQGIQVPVIGHRCVRSRASFPLGIRALGHPGACHRASLCSL